LWMIANVATSQNWEKKEKKKIPWLEDIFAFWIDLYY
jgi:hypothetical protein